MRSGAPCSVLVAAVALLASGLPAEESAVAPSSRPEDAILRRNLVPDGTDPYQFSLDRLRVTGHELTPEGVQLHFADDGEHSVADVEGETKIVTSPWDGKVPLDGSVRLEQLRAALEPIDGKDTYLDVLAGYFVVRSPAPCVNDAIRDIETYPETYGNETYKYSWYLSGEYVEPEEEYQKRLGQNVEDRTAHLQGESVEVLSADSNMFTLDLVIGQGNMVEKALAHPTMIHTSYRIAPTAEEGESPSRVVIVNENELAFPDEKNGGMQQNALWILEPIQLPGEAGEADEAGEGDEAGEDPPVEATLVRYIQASRSYKPAPLLAPKGAFREIRLRLTLLNVEAYLVGIRERARARAGCEEE